MRVVLSRPRVKCLCDHVVNFWTVGVAREPSHDSILAFLGGVKGLVCQLGKVRHHGATE